MGKMSYGSKPMNPCDKDICRSVAEYKAVWEKIPNFSSCFVGVSNPIKPSTRESCSLCWGDITYANVR